ncbi:ferredoxin [Candidatus Wolfebacteria bacterium]|nr:ferredoxin [Candidatus Wolfebacteria bacterium]
MSKIIHQRGKCLGCGACAAVCPKFFEMDKKDGLANLKNSKKVGDNFELEINKVGCIKEAIETCPTKIIKIKN